MDFNMLAAGIMIGFAALGAALGNSFLFSKYIEGITRQPETRGTLFGHNYDPLRSDRGPSDHRCRDRDPAGFRYYRLISRFKVSGGGVLFSPPSVRS